MQPIIETKKLTHIYSAGTPFERGALVDVDFTAYEGEYLGIIGHTGSGKSTLIQHLNALLKPTSGQVLFQGKDIWSDPKTTRQTRFQVGLVFQYPEYQLFEETIYKDIAFGPRNMGLNEQEIDRRVREAAYFVGLRDDQLEKSPFELSGGQKRRVAIAGVIAMEPKVLILDEPTAGLDPVGVESILGNIRDYHQAHNATIILVSHSMEEVARTVDRLVVVNDGTIPFQGAPRQVFQHGEELESMGLGVPQMTRVFGRLRDMGVDIDSSVYTIQQAREAILKAKGWAEMALKDITLGQYFPGNSVVHRLDPRTKLIAVALYIVSLFLCDFFLTYAIMFGALCLCIRLSKVPVKAILRGMKPVLFIATITAVLNLFYTPGEHVLAKVWIFQVTLEGVYAAFFMVIRIMMLIAGTFLLTYTTSPILLTDGLESLMNPLKKIKVPVHELAMMMSIALRFIPTLIEETDKIMSAQRARGADFESGNLMQRAKALTPLLVPLFISAFRRADELAVAMECRCYRGGEGRTRLRQLKYQGIDWVAIVGFLALTVGVGVLGHFGF